MKLLNRLTFFVLLFGSLLFNASTVSAQLGFAASNVSNFEVAPTGFNEVNTLNDVNIKTEINSFNSIHYTTCVGLTSGGTVAANQQNCVAFTPNAFTNSVSASGGSGGSIVYQWQKLVSCGSFTNISGATAATYASGSVTKTTIFKRKAWRNCAGGTGSVAVYSNEVTVLIVYPGTISGDESGNCNFNSSTITGTNHSADNNYCLSDGTPQNQSYQWQKSIDGGNTWTDISGANAQNYSPGSITQTAKFRRATTVSGYTTYSNVVTKTVNISPITLSTESFPNSFNTGFTAPINTNFNGSTGSWGAYSTTARSTVVVHSAYYQSSPYALKMVNYSTNGYAATSSKATSPKIDLSAGNNVELSFKLYTYSVSSANTCYSIKLEFSNDNGATWNLIESSTAQEIANAYGQGTWNTVSLTVPGNYYNSNFRYRFATEQAAGCNYNTYLYIDDITFKSYPTCLPCPSSTNAGIDSTQCNNPDFTMAATPAPQGSTGTWSVINGSANISNVNSPTSVITVTGSPATLRWTVSTPGCPDVYDDVVLTNTNNVTTLSYESFTNSFNTGFTAPINTTFTGSTGTWSAYSSTSRSTIVVNNAHVQSAPYALKIVNYNTNGYAATTSRAKSPKINLTGGNNVEMSFKLYTYSVSNSNTCFTFNVEISNDNGTTWTTVLAQTSKQLENTYGQGTWNTITIPIPVSYYNANFRYRYSGVQQANCCYDTYLYIDDIRLNSNTPCVPCPSSTDAGSDITQCNDANFTMSATPAPQGSTGTWSVVSGTATILNANSPTTTVTTTSSPVTLRWTLVTPGCPNVTDDVVLTNNAQVVTLSNESFTNSFNTGFSAPINSTFTGAIGTWGAYSSTSRSTIVVNNAHIQSAPYALKIYSVNTNGYSASTARATSPTVNLTSGSNVEMSFRLYTYAVNANNTGYSFNVEFSSDNGSTWTNVFTRTSQELYNVYGQSTWNTINISVPNSYYNANFKYRLSGVIKANTNYDTHLYIDDITFKSYPPCLPCPTEADAGADISNCNNATFTMDATPAPQGSTGTWSVISGNASISNVNSPTSSVTVSGSPATLRWTITTPGCPTIYDDVVLTNNDNVVTLSTESFPNSFNTGFTAPINSTFTGSTGTWGAYSSTSRSTIVVHNSNYQSAPYALKLYNISTSGYAATTARATSPKLDLTGGDSVVMSFRILPHTVSGSNTCYTLKLEFSNDNGSTWNVMETGTAQDIYNTLGQGTWSTVSYVVPSMYYNANFKYRFVTSQAAGCNYNTYIYVDDITFKSYPPCLPCPTNDDVDAGVDQGQCNNNIFTMSASAPPQGSTGTWSIISGTATIANINSPTTAVTVTGSPVTLKWTITTPGCITPAFDTVTLTNTVTTTANAGSDQSICGSNSFTMSANAVGGGETGTWTVISGAATISNVNSPTTLVNVTTSPAVLRWTISKNGCSTYDEVTLTVTNGSSLLGDFVWWDINDNGIQDAGEPGIDGVTVKLYADANSDNIPDSNVPLFTTTTNASGQYLFNNLCTGKYIVSIVTPDGYEQGTTTGTSSDPNNGSEYDNNGVAIYNGTEIRTNNVNFSLNNPRVDFGLKGKLNLGNLVWMDQCNYGTKDNSETGVNGVTVYLYRDANADNLPDGSAIKTTTTNVNGIYNFGTLAPGKYIVGILLPTGYASTVTTINSSNPNSDTDNDNNGIRTSSGILYSNFITLTFGGEPNTGIDGDGTNGNLTLDFGIAKDTDGDRIADIIDIDDDNDGITDVNESGGFNPLGDCDNDCIPNYLDNTPGNGCPEWSDCNGDGINDFYDWDRDGIINSLDLDSDNDGILDVMEARPSANAFNNHSNGMITGTDTDANGLLSSADNGSGFNNPHLNGLIPHDLDRDGKPNFLDLDSDGDGITDLTEALGVYSSTGVVTGTDEDGDGVRGENFGNNGANVADNINGFGAKGVTLLDSDNDGRPNAYDIDSDNDGITDNTEAQATCSFKMPLYSDCDNDGVDDAYDIGGCASCTRTSGGLTPFDKDGDSTPDYLDLDTDNDSAPDIYEGHTIKTVNYWIGATGDADKDGLMDYFDGYNIITATDGLYWRNVINNNMGNFGSWDTGVGSTGSISQLPKSRPGACNVGDRDWRDFYILPVTIVEFKGNITSDAIAKLNWSVTNEININHYDLERSTNGSEFSKVAQVNAINASSSSAISNYNANDNVAGLNGIIYYRLKIVENDGTIKYSNVINFKLSQSTRTVVSLYPNPAVNNFTVKITSPKDETVQVRVFDMLGKVLLSQQSTIVVGINNLSFNNISKLSTGTYTVQIIMSNQVFTEKLVVTK